MGLRCAIILVVRGLSVLVGWCCLVISKLTMGSQRIGTRLKRACLVTPNTMRSSVPSYTETEAQLTTKSSMCGGKQDRVYHEFK
jgi:hypothetical protein